MIPAWGEKLPFLYQEYVAGRVPLYQHSGISYKLTKDQKKEIKNLKIEEPKMKVIAVIDKIYNCGGVFTIKFHDFLMIGEREEPILGYENPEVVYFYAYVKNIATECCYNYKENEDVGDIGKVCVREDIETHDLIRID